MHVKSFVVCIVGKMAQGVKVLWVHSHLVSHLFSFRNFFVTCFCCNFRLVRGGRREDAWSVNYKTIELLIHKEKGTIINSKN